MATSLGSLGKKPLICTAFDLFRRLLITMGIPQSVPYVIDCSVEKVSGHIVAMKAEVAQAKASGGYPWNARHCYVPASATALDNEHRNLPGRIGLACFNGSDLLAIQHGLEFSEDALVACKPSEARWATRNVLDNPNLQHQERAPALHLHGEACA